MQGNNKVLIAADEDGKRLVVLPQVIFEGKRSISWNDVEQYLLRYVGDIVRVAETEDLVYIGRDFADEYSHSKYTEKLRGGLAKTKANMVQGIHGMIEIAGNRRWNEDFEKRHGKKAENGWYRYDTRFAMPIMNEKGEIIRYNVYLAVLIVRYASNNKLYLYDIQNIKKETSIPSRTDL